MTSLTNPNLELKNMFGQFMKMNNASSSGSGTILSNTVTNPKEDLKGITTRSGNAYQGPMIPTTYSFPPKVVEHKIEIETPIPNSEPVVAPIAEPIIAPVSAPKPNPKTSIPYSSRLHDQKLRDKANYQKEKFFQIFKDLDFNISFTDALILMPKFGPTIKSLLTNKDKLFELDRTLLNEHCSTILLKELPEKLGDSHKFLIPLRIKLSLPELTEDVFVKNDMTANRIDAIDIACEEYSQEVLGFSDVIASGDPTPYYDPIISTSSPTLTPFGDSDFLLEEVEAFLTLEDDPTSPKVDHSYYDTEGDILLLESFLNDDPSYPIPIKEYLSFEEKAALIKVLKSHKQSIAWKVSDINGINPEFCTHKILIEDDFKPAKISNFTRRIKEMHVIVGNFTYVMDFMIVEDISSIIDPRLSQVVLGKPFIEISNMTHDPPERVVRFSNGTDKISYKMPRKVEQYNSLSNLEKEHIKSIYLRNKEDKRRGSEYMMNKILGFYKECLELGPEYVTGMDDEGEVTLYLMRRSLEVLRKFHWTILGGRFNKLSHTNDELTTKEAKQVEADDQAIQTILMGLPEDIYNAGNQIGYNTGQNVGIQIGQNAGNLIRLIVVPGFENQNENENVVAAQAENNEEARVQLQAKEFDLMVVADDCEEIEEVNRNCVLMDDLQQASTLGTQADKAPVYDSDGSAEELYTLEMIMTKKVMETMNVTFDELLAMAFEQRSSKPELQGLYDDYMGGQPSDATRTAPSTPLTLNL
nr:reverse transcriptase domain-containing protein [Tanacetum cinerariifolium]